MSEEKIAKRIWLDLKPSAFKLKWARQTLKFMGDVRYPFPYEELKAVIKENSLNLSTERRKDLTVNYRRKWTKGSRNKLIKWVSKEVWNTRRKGKSYVRLYLTKETICYERIYDNSWGRALLFQAKYGFLPLRKLTSKW